MSKLPVRLTQHQSGVDRVKVPLHLSTGCLRRKQTKEQSGKAPSDRHWTQPSVSYLLYEEPGVAGSSQYGGFLQTVLEDGLQGRTQRPSDQVCHRLSHRVITRQRVLGTADQLYIQYWQTHRLDISTKITLTNLSLFLLDWLHNNSLTNLFAPLIEDFYELGWKPTLSKRTDHEIEGSPEC